MTEAPPSPAAEEFAKAPAAGAEEKFHLSARLFPVQRPGRLRAPRPDLGLGIGVAVISVAAATAAIYALKSLAPVVSLSVVYLPAVLVVSAYWGLGLGLFTSLISAAAFNFFHLPPIDRFTISDSRNWVALIAFVVVAVAVSTIADLARNRAMEADRRRAEADLAAALARELLGGTETSLALSAAAHRVAEALDLSSASIELGTRQGDERRRAAPLSGADGIQVATLLVPRKLSSDAEQRLETYVVPALGALVAIAVRRDALQAEAVETAALRRSDDVKTALLRAVSHDLRTPVTAIVAAGHALGSDSLTPAERTELSQAVIEEGEQLAALVDKLLDLSRLQAGRAEPREDWVSLEDVVLAARDSLPDSSGDVRLAMDPDVPPVRADAAQLERAFANLLENALRYSGGLPVSVRIRRSGSRAVVRVVDQGPGIRPADRARIFEPFYRGPGARDEPWGGSGLGLAIAKGFVEANGGTISVESLPGQGSSFVVALPIEQPALPDPDPAPAAPLPT
ncbi:MAG TPA: ATP-binding protein [Solirubrobacteraceae bacterium]|nr:ATP-binding protein [Solirubrobacteraceae bacterium]